MRLNKRFLIVIGIFLTIAFALSAKIFLDSIYRLPILMYHSIDYTLDKQNRLVVFPEIFEKQMKYLHDHGYNVVPLDKAVSYIVSAKHPPPKTVALTIDDGYENNYKYAYPILKKYHIPATIFVIINKIGNDKDFMNWNEIKEMSDSGIIDIESHTVSHPWLTSLDDASLKNELIESKRILKEKLGKDINFLCYPMGVYDERVKSATQAAGYKAAFGTKPTRLSPNYDIYEIKRVRISPTANNQFVFAIKLSGYHAFFKIIKNDYKDIPYVK